MKNIGQSSPMLFDLDSPNPYKFRRLSGSYGQSNKSSTIQFALRTSDNPKSLLKMTSIKIDQPHFGQNEQQNNLTRLKSGDNQPPENQMQKSHKNHKNHNNNKKKVMFGRQYSQPLYISTNKIMNSAIHQSVSNNQNVKMRVTSLQKYFQQTQSIQMPYRTMNRIHDNQRFVEEVGDFQRNLQQIRQNSKQNVPTERINNKRNRLAQTRPKKLRINELQNQKVKQQKDKILISRIINQKKKYSVQQVYQQYKYTKKPINMKLQQLGQTVQNMYESVRMFKYYLKRTKQVKKQVLDKILGWKKDNYIY